VLKVLDDQRALAEAAAQRCTEILADAVSAHGSASLFLAGGSTPRGTYQRLAAKPWCDRVPWDRVDVYWSDERHVPPDHPDSNYRMAYEALVRHVPIPAAQVHRIEGERGADEAADLYERELPQRVDLVLLGIGADAHIASLFPGSPALTERARRVVSVWVPHLDTYRVTLTPRALLEARHLLVITAGTEKAEAVATALESPPDVPRYPVHLLREAEGGVEWFIDRAAAARLRRQSPRLPTTS
jgi:6-phosphogluconolactonase